jgi:hypothetical protein
VLLLAFFGVVISCLKFEIFSDSLLHTECIVAAIKFDFAWYLFSFFHTICVPIYLVPTGEFIVSVAHIFLTGNTKHNSEYQVRIIYY